MSIAELQTLPRAQKIEIMEALWKDLTANEADYPSPAWHRSELEKTEADFRAGRIQPIDWESSKKALRSGLK